MHSNDSCLDIIKQEMPSSGTGASKDTGNSGFFEKTPIAAGDLEKNEAEEGGMLGRAMASLENTAASLGAYVGYHPEVVKKGVQVTEEAMQHPQVIHKGAALGATYVKENARDKLVENYEKLKDKSDKLKENLKDDGNQAAEIMFVKDSKDISAMAKEKGSRMSANLKEGHMPAKEASHSVLDTLKHALEEGGEMAYEKTRDTIQEGYHKAAEAWQATKDTMKGVHDISVESGQQIKGSLKGQETSAKNNLNHKNEKDTHDIYEISDVKNQLRERTKSKEATYTSPAMQTDWDIEPSDFSSWDEAEKIAYQKARQQNLKR
jgi:cell division protein FtsB